MATLNMNGPYVLVPDKIDENVGPNLPGNYGVGYVSETDFIVLYVGRSDVDINAELKNWVYRKSDCLFFKFSIAKSPEEAFYKECINFHDFSGSTNLRNDKHPAHDESLDWKCPHCGAYG